MNRRFWHLGSAIMAVWVMIFTIAAPLGLVVCIGDDGHLALEKDHQRGHGFHSPDIMATVSHTHGGDCSDTPVLLYYGRVRTGPQQQTTDNIVFSDSGLFSKLPVLVPCRFADEALISVEFTTNYLIGLSTVILIC